MNNIEKGGKVKNFIIIMLSIILVIALGFICYDRFLNKEESIKQNCKCPTCEKCIDNKSVDEPEKKEICELDMTNKTELDVYGLCKEKGIDNASRVKIRNISINNKSYVLFHDFEPFYDLKGTYVHHNAVTKLYINGFLLDVYKGQNREILWSIKIEGTSIIISETWPSEAPPVDYTYDLNNFDKDKYNYDLGNLK